MNSSSTEAAPRAGELRKFGLLVGGVFVGLAALASVRDRAPAMIGVLGAVGGALILLGALTPMALGPVYSRWVRLSLLLNKVTAPILMGGVYFLVLTPFAIVLRAIGRRPLASPSPTASAWVERAAESRASDLERQF